jgi:hypothetical protein
VKDIHLSYALFHSTAHKSSALKSFSFCEQHVQILVHNSQINKLIAMSNVVERTPTNSDGDSSEQVNQAALRTLFDSRFQIVPFEKKDPIPLSTPEKGTYVQRANEASIDGPPVDTSKLKLKFSNAISDASLPQFLRASTASLEGVDIICLNAPMNQLALFDPSASNTNSASTTTASSSTAEQSSPSKQQGSTLGKVVLMYGAALATEAVMLSAVATGGATLIPVLLTTLGGLVYAGHGSWFGEGEQKAFVVKVDEKAKGLQFDNMELPSEEAKFVPHPSQEQQLQLATASTQSPVQGSRTQLIERK